MASWQARDRDPLLDENMQALLERRAQELIGAALLVLAALVTLMLATHSPDDPGWMVATSEPPANLLGRFGAAVSSTLTILIGRGAWALPVILAIWGGRLVLHRGTERIPGRLVFAVFAIAMAAIHASTLAAPADWPHSFGLGGLFGDTAAGTLIGVMPAAPGVALKLLSLLTFVGTVALVVYVTAFDRREIRRILSMALIGTLVISGRIWRLLVAAGGMAAGQGARGIGAMARRRNVATLRGVGARDAVLTGRGTAGEWDEDAEGAASIVRRGHGRRLAANDEAFLAPEPLGVSASVAHDAGAGDARPALRADPRWPVAMAGNAPVARGDDRPGILARIRRVIDKGGATPDVVESDAPDDGALTEPSFNQRVEARIANAIRARARRVPAASAPARGAHPAAQSAREEPPLLRPRRPRALVLAPRHGAQSPIPGARPEPPLVATDGAWAVPNAMDNADSDMPGDDALDEGMFSAPETAMADAPAFRAATAAAPDVPSAPRAADVPDAAEKPARRKAPRPVRPDYEVPPLSLLSAPAPDAGVQLSDGELEANARLLEEVLDDYGVRGEIVSVRPGPVVTMYELEPAPGLKASRVIGLADDIARSMSALSARVSTIPGRSVIGIELPNEKRETVYLREILSSRAFGSSHLRLPLALGKDIGGDPFVANLAKMPHLLIAGTTGSGKSVAINTMIMSLLYKLRPEDCRLIMIDPKMLELSVYDGIPHLLSPVVTDPKKAVVALKWVVGEMEERYRKMSRMGVRNIEGYNGRVREALAQGEMFSRTIQTGFDDDTGEPVFETEEFAPEPFPYIVVIVDEMADLMMVAGKEIEACIQRLAQMARASGIHLIMATQRPSVDVITGTIKANFPTRISFHVTSKIDSRTILGEQGAEQLLGMGDMLYMGGGARITRLHGPFVSDEEVEEIVNYLKSFGPPDYTTGVVEGPDEDKADDIDLVLGLGGEGDSEDDLYRQAVMIVAKDRRCSTSYIQRKLSIGYNRAARLVERMEDEQIVTPADHVGKRDVLVPET